MPALCHSFSQHYSQQHALRYAARNKHAVKPGFIRRIYYQLMKSARHGIVHGIGYIRSVSALLYQALRRAFGARK